MNAQACLDRAMRRAAVQLEVIQEAATCSPLIADLYAGSDRTVDIASRVREARADLEDEALR